MNTKSHRNSTFATPWTGAAAIAIVALVLLALYTNRVQSRLDQTSTQLSTLQNQIHQWQAAHAQLQQANENLQQQLQANKNELQQARDQLHARQNEFNELQAAHTQLRQTNAALQQQMQTNQELLVLIAETNPRRVIHLPGMKESPDAAGTFFLSDDDRGVLVLQGLKPLPAAQTYQLWLIPTEGAPASAGLLEVQLDGSTWFTVDVPARARNFVAVGVSIEPAGGSPAPAGPIVLLGTIG